MHAAIATAIHGPLLMLLPGHVHVRTHINQYQFIITVVHTHVLEARVQFIVGARNNGLAIQLIMAAQTRTTGALLNRDPM